MFGIIWQKKQALLIGGTDSSIAANRMLYVAAVSLVNFKINNMWHYLIGLFEGLFIAFVIWCKYSGNENNGQKDCKNDGNAM